MSALTTHTFGHLVTKEKRKRKETTKGNSNKRLKAKERQRARSLEEEQVSDPLGKGNGSTHPRQNMLKQRAQTTNPKLEQHKEFPLSQSTLPLSQCSNATWECKKEQKPAQGG
jgi:hypothetical protein